MRKSISVAFFSMVSTLMVLGTCGDGLLGVGAVQPVFCAGSVRNAGSGGKRCPTHGVSGKQRDLPQGEELEALSTKLEIIGESAEAYLFFTDRDGNVMLASDPDKLTTDTVPLDICQRANAGRPGRPSTTIFRRSGRCADREKLYRGGESAGRPSLFSG